MGWWRGGHLLGLYQHFAMCGDVDHQNKDDGGEWGDKLKQKALQRVKEEEEEQNGLINAKAYCHSANQRSQEHLYKGCEMETGLINQLQDKQTDL